VSSLLTIQICAALLSVLSAAVAWKQVSVSSRTLKRLRDLETTAADLNSSFDSLMESHKRLRSRTGMREIREREEQPKHETKEQARARVFGREAGPGFARRQLEIERGS
jgi:hypothetical protein